MKRPCKLFRAAEKLLVRIFCNINRKHPEQGKGNYQKEIKSFDDCKNLLQSGNNVSSTERVAAIKEGVKYETDEGVQKLYQQFLDNPNEETLKKFYRAASKKYHPDLPANKGVEAAGEKFVYYGNLQSFAEKNMTLFSKAA